MRDCYSDHHLRAKQTGNEKNPQNPGNGEFWSKSRFRLLFSGSQTEDGT
jgi:hypothetical protein